MYVIQCIAFELLLGFSCVNFVFFQKGSAYLPDFFYLLSWANYILLHLFYTQMRTGLGRASDFPGQFVHLSQLLTTCVYIHPHLFLFSSANILTLSEGNPEVMPHRKPWCYRCPSVGRWETTTENIEQNKPTLRGVCISHRYIGTYVCDSW